jgi:hypothetical protein
LNGINGVSFSQQSLLPSDRFAAKFLAMLTSPNAQTPMNLATRRMCSRSAPLVVDPQQPRPCPEVDSFDVVHSRFLTNVCSNTHRFSFY